MRDFQLKKWKRIRRRRKIPKEIEAQLYDANDAMSTNEYERKHILSMYSRWKTQYTRTHKQQACFQYIKITRSWWWKLWPSGEKKTNSNQMRYKQRKISHRVSWSTWRIELCIKIHTQRERVSKRTSKRDTEHDQTIQ